MTDLILFTLNAIVIYLLADWLLRMLERRRGTPFKQRQVMFFLIFLCLALASFALMRHVLATS